MCLEATVLGRPELKVEQKGQDHLCLPEPTGESVFLLPSALLHADESCAGRCKDWALASAQPGNRAAGLGRNLGPLEAAACVEMGGQVQCSPGGFQGPSSFLFSIQSSLSSTFLLNRFLLLEFVILGTAQRLIPPGCTSLFGLEDSDEVTSPWKQVLIPQLLSDVLQDDVSGAPLS